MDIVKLRDVLEAKEPSPSSHGGSSGLNPAVHMSLTGQFTAPSTGEPRCLALLLFNSHSGRVHLLFYLHRSLLSKQTENTW